MKTILTIDLDYWTNCYKRKNNKGLSYLKTVTGITKNLAIIEYHHEILPFITNDIECVINMDFHNDILGKSSFDKYPPPKKYFNEGTWGNFLPKNVKRFEWYYPNKKKCVDAGMGLCIDPHGVVHEDYPIEYKQDQGYPFSISDVSGIVICVSPQWQNESSVEPYLTAIGLENENIKKFPLIMKGFKNVKTG